MTRRMLKSDSHETAPSEDFQALLNAAVDGIVVIDAQGRVRVKVGVNSQGQGHETTLAQVCADILGADFANVEVLGGDTSLMRVGFGTGASRVAVNAGNAVFKAAQSVRGKAVRLAAELLQCGEDEVEVKDGIVSVIGARQNAIGLGELAARATRHPRMAELGGPGLQATEFFYPRTVTWASGVNVAVVEVDSETGQVNILKYVFVHDCGLPLNPMIVDGQTQGGIVTGLGQALFEECWYDRETGQMLSASLMDYALPRAGDVVSFKTHISEIPATSHPLGLRPAGEGGTTPALAVAINAIVDALAEYGIEHIEMPATPLKVWRAIRDAKARRATH